MIMKKIYLFLGISVIAGQAFAQTPVSSMNYRGVKVTKHTSLKETHKAKPAASAIEKGITLWSNTCDDAADWTFTNTSIPSGTNWSIMTGPFNASIQAGTPFETFESDTPGDGYLMIDSDAVGGLDGDGTPIVCEATISVPTGTLSGSPFVSLKFKHNYRWWQDTRGVRVSGDNGATWTDFPITSAPGGAFASGYPDAQDSENPQEELINISSVAGGQSDVLVQFYYNDNDFWAWYWVVDDVEIVETDEFDLAVTGLYWGSLGAFGARLPYYQVPVNQIAAVDLGGRVTNFGYANQNDVVFSISEATSGFSGTSANTSITTFAIDTLELTTQFTPAGIGTYTFDAGVTSPNVDVIPADNTVAGIASFVVSNTTYAREDGNRTGGTLNRDGDGNAAGYQVGNVFDIVTSDELYGIDFYVSPTSDVDADYSGTLYSIDPTTGDFIYVDETDIGVLTADDLDTWITVTFNTPQTLNAGESYLVVVGSQGGIGTNGLVTGTSGNSEDQTSFYFDPTDPTGGPDGTWFYTTSTPMVRMNFDLSLNTENIAENSMNLTVYPNPAKDVANVNFELENNSTVTLTIADLSGKVVFTATEENVAAGKHSITVPTAELANGVYTYSFAAGNSVVTEKLVINK